MTSLFGFALTVALLAPTPPEAATCVQDRFEDVPYTACAIDPGSDQLQLRYLGDDGTLLGSFSALSDAVSSAGRTLVLAMNGGMYHPDRRPVGLYVEDGVELSPIALADGPGNFGLLPNGVFCLYGKTARVIESRKFAGLDLECDYAAQSGPLLVEDSVLHPSFLPRSDSALIRNGVGVREDGTVVIAIADAPINFHRFARLFRDQLGTPDALYIDGRVSRLYAPALGRNDFGLPMGPILAVTRPAD